MARRNKAAAERELDALAEDWVALWQSEIAGLMADPELAAAWGTMAAMGNAWLRALAGGLPGGAAMAAPGFPFAPPRPADDPDAATTASARPAPAAAAPDAGGQPGRPGAGQHPAGPTDAERLAERLAELERRLAEVELRPPGSRPHRRGTGRRRPSA